MKVSLSVFLLLTGLLYSQTTYKTNGGSLGSSSTLNLKNGVCTTVSGTNTGTSVEITVDTDTGVCQTISDAQQNNNKYCLTTGTNTAYACDPAQAYTDAYISDGSKYYKTGSEMLVDFHTGCGSNPTLNVSSAAGGSAKPILTYNGNAPATTDCTASSSGGTRRLVFQESMNSGNGAWTLPAPTGGDPAACGPLEEGCWMKVDTFSWDVDSSDGKVGDWQWSTGASTATGTITSYGTSAAGKSPGMALATNGNNYIVLDGGGAYQRPIGSAAKSDWYYHFRTGNINYLNWITLGVVGGTGEGPQWVMTGSTTVFQGYSGGSPTNAPQTYSDQAANTDYVLHFWTTDYGDTWTATWNGHTYTLGTGITGHTATDHHPFVILSGSAALSGWQLRKIAVVMRGN